MKLSKKVYEKQVSKYFWVLKLVTYITSLMENVSYVIAILKMHEMREKCVRNAPEVREKCTKCARYVQENHIFHE